MPRPRRIVVAGGVGARIATVPRIVRKLSLLVSSAIAFACTGTEDPVDPPVRDGGFVTSRDGGTRDGGEVVRDAGVEPPPCDGRPGVYAGQTIDVEGEERFYYLFVPSGYDCRVATPLLMDFHGTGSGEPETAYRNAELVDLAETEGFIVVRPRSRSSAGQQGRVYRWDQNPGDLERNVRFTAVLLDDLRSRYHVDAARTYASGFSSGTNMISQLLMRRDLFKGFGFVGGGFWNTPVLPSFDPDAFSIYAVTGYRDYLIGTVRPMFDSVVAAGLDPSRIFFSENDAGHELYGWHFAEMWAWLDAGERPEDAPLAAGWTAEDLSTEDSLIEVAAAANGDLLVATSGGRILRRTAGVVSEVGLAAGIPLTGICTFADGRALAVGGGAVMVSDDHGASWTRAPNAPETEGRWFGYAYLNDVACANAGLVVSAGYWSALGSDDGAATWFARPMSYRGFGGAAQLAAVDVSTSSTAVAVGYFYFGRAGAGEDFVDRSTPPDVEWLNGVTHVGTTWWVVGERGVVLRSTDDAVTFDRQTTPTEADLYAVDFADDRTGLAVGNAGTALLTTDGGATWQDVSPGVAGFLGDVVFTAPDRALVVGERGTALWFSVP